MTRDTNPDLTFVRLSRKARGRVGWINTGENLRSDHHVLEIALPVSAAPAAANKQKKRITDWTLFRTRADEEQEDDITDIDAWTKALVRTIADATTEHEADEETPQLASRLAHLLDARRSLQERWKKWRKTNRRLPTKIAKLGREIAVGRLQTAFEDHLADTGLRCAPQKSELLIVATPGRRGKNSNEKLNITVRTRDGIPIPQVATLRVLGMYLEASGSNNTMVHRILTKIGTAARLIRRVATKHQGMR